MNLHTCAAMRIRLQATSLVLVCFAAWLSCHRCLSASLRSRNGQPSGTAAAREALATLKAECFACHNAEKKKGGLVLTSREALLKGNDEGAVVVSGKPDLSRLAKALLRDADPHMPPKKQLTDAQIKTMRDWIKAGLGWDAKVLADDEVNVAPVKLAPLP